MPGSGINIIKETLEKLNGENCLLLMLMFISETLKEILSNVEHLCGSFKDNLHRETHRESMQEAQQAPLTRGWPDC